MLKAWNFTKYFPSHPSVTSVRTWEPSAVILIRCGTKKKRKAVFTWPYKPTPMSKQVLAVNYSKGWFAILPRAKKNHAIARDGTAKRGALALCAKKKGNPPVEKGKVWISKSFSAPRNFIIIPLPLY
jgi:hypothetical protein